MENKIQREPYQPFFFSGLLLSILGLGVWILFQLGWLSVYPQDAHAFLMIMGFLFAYISGFLMTAVPKMTNSQSAKPYEVMVGVSLLWLQAALIFVGEIRINFAIGFLQILFLILFLGIRFFHRKSNPPKAFVFLPFGLISGALGCLLLSFHAGFFPLSISLLAKALLYQAFALNLIMGLGSRLVPALTRVQGALDVRAMAPEKISSHLSLAILLNSSFLVEVFFSPPIAQLMKFSVISWMAIQNFKILKPRQVKGILGLGIRASVLFLSFGFLLAGLFPSYAIHFLHLSFIGGFALLTILISTRVVLAHGGYSLDIELKSQPLKGILILAFAMCLLRVTMGFQGQHRSELFWILVLSWAATCLLWSYSFLLKLLKIDK